MEKKIETPIMGYIGLGFPCHSPLLEQGTPATQGEPKVESATKTPSTGDVLDQLVTAAPGAHNRV